MRGSFFLPPITLRLLPADIVQFFQVLFCGQNNGKLRILCLCRISKALLHPSEVIFVDTFSGLGLSSERYCSQEQAFLGLSYPWGGHRAGQENLRKSI